MVEREEIREVYQTIESRDVHPLLRGINATVYNSIKHSKLYTQTKYDTCKVQPQNGTKDVYTQYSKTGMGSEARDSMHHSRGTALNGDYHDQTPHNITPPSLSASTHVPGLSLDCRTRHRAQTS